MLFRSSEDPMGNILQGRYTDFTNEDADYPSVVSIKKVGFMPAPRPTIASQSQSVARQRKEEKVCTVDCTRYCTQLNFSLPMFAQEKPKHFIMKRFQNVKGKFQQEREEMARSQGSHGSSGGDGGREENPAYSDEEY